VAKQVIAHCYQVAEEGLAAVPAIAAIDSLREVNGSESKSIDRSKIRLVQTPQVFNTETLKKAYEQPFSPLFTDDASVMEASGNRITLVDGNVENIKITTPLDLIIAEGVLANIPLS
jgi:4-diphosphocytidyl-2-methyl-D-erithritol synthase